MLIAKRNAMSGKSLPYSKRVSYLESDGRQYIPFDIYWESGMSYEITAQCTGDFSLTKAFFGFSADWGMWLGNVNRRFAISAESTFLDSSVKNTIKGRWYNGYHYANDKEAPIRNHGYERKLTLFDSIAEIHYFIKGRIWDFALTNSEGNVLLKLIPVLDYTGRPGMYDEVSNQIYYNSGTGEFLYGELT